MELDPRYFDKLKLLGISTVEELSRSAAEKACEKYPDRYDEIWQCFWYLKDNPQPKVVLNDEELLIEMEKKKKSDEEERQRAILLRGKPEIRGTQTIHGPGVVLSNTSHPDRPNGWENSQWWSGGE